MTMDGPLVKWVQVVDRRNNIFKALVTEADEIKADRNIIAYEKQAKRKVSTKLTEDQVNNSSIELEKWRTQLSNTCSQEGVDHLVFRTEAAKNQLFRINKRFPEYHINPKLAERIKNFIML